MPARIHVRPDLPYNAVSKHNDNRYQLLSARGSPPSGEMLDADDNYLIDSLDQLSVDIDGVIAGNIPGFDDIENRYKFLTTDGENLGWSLVREFNVGNEEISTRNIRDGSVTEEKLGDGAVTANKISVNAISNEKILDEAITTSKISNGDVTSIKLSNDSVTTEKISDGAVTEPKHADISVSTRVLQNGSVTLAKLSAEVLRSLTPVGTMHAYGAAAAPDGFLLCNGSPVSRVDYAALFAVLGTRYGAGDGVATFNLPDRRGRVSAGSINGDTNGRITNATANTTDIGGVGGAEQVTLDINQIPAHTHLYTKPSLVADYRGGPNQIFVSSVTDGVATSSTGGSGAHNNMSPFILDNYIIKY